VPVNVVSSEKIEKFKEKLGMTWLFNVKGKRKWMES